MIGGNEPSQVTDAATTTLSQHSVEAIEQTVARLEIDEPEEHLQQWLNLSSVLLQRAKQIRQRIEDLSIEWIIAKGPIEVGDLRYSVGHAKAVKCVDATRCMMQLLEACHGDIGGVTDFLAANPWKYGSVRNLLGDLAFNQLFVTETKIKLVEGIAKPILITTNPRFAKPRKPTPASAEDKS